MSINPSIYAPLPYEPRRQFAPVINLASIPQVLVVASSSRFHSVQDLVEAVMAEPGKLSYGSAGKGTTQHLTMELLKARLKLDLVHVPYKGAPPATNDLLGGHIVALFDSVPSVLPLIASGKLRALSVSLLRRSPFLPGVPSLDETVAPGFNAVAWIGIAVPAKAPEPIVRLLNLEIAKSLQQPELQERMRQLAFEPIGDSPEQFSKFTASEIENWVRVVKDSGTKID